MVFEHYNIAFGSSFFMLTSLIYFCSTFNKHNKDIFNRKASYQNVTFDI